MQAFLLAKRLVVVEGTLEEIDMKHVQFISNEIALQLRNAVCSGHKKQLKLHLSLIYWPTLQSTLTLEARKQNHIMIASDLCIRDLK